MERVALERKVLSENDRVAGELRERFAQRGILVLNFISSPGSGKTALLERTLEAFPAGTRVAVLTGDIQTDNDAQRLARYGFPVRQISTGGACHLDARMIERVGNLVCPTSYDLGERAKIVVLSVTEGEDKPLKYPGIFHKAELMILNKIDLLPYVPFKAELARECANRVHPGIEILEVSCTTGAGLDAWQGWLAERRART